MRRQTTASRDRLNTKRRALRTKLPKLRKGPTAKSLKRKATAARHEQYRQADRIARNTAWL